MSGISILKSGLIASACVAGLTLSACASSNTHNDSRYGVAAYEGGDECTVNPCGPVVSAPAQDSRYGSATSYETAPAVAYQAPPAVVYQQQPAPAYTTQSTTTYTSAPSTSYSTSQYVGETADCPPGTNRSGDGTCMMSSNTSTYSSGSTYSAPTSSYSTGSSYSSGSTSSSYMAPGETADCPAGTSRSNDGTCMMSAGSTLNSMGSISAGTTTTSPYAGSSATLYSGTSDTTQYADCPAGSTRSASGSCTVSSGYVPSTTYTPPATYLPIRK